MRIPVSFSFSLRMERAKSLTPSCGSLGSFLGFNFYVVILNFHSCLLFTKTVQFEPACHPGLVWLKP